MGKGLFKKIPTKIYHRLVGKAVQWAKNTCCSCKRPWFSHQHPHCGLQPSVTLVLGNQTPSSDL